ncbi:MAG: hypothetical protein CMI08_08950 [Oceanospirillaceae bacterium]|nr:hypothetical protein [Oceanospirillaceae bacterium]MAX99319.1 hypothetical protein [Oceanospirillaceae bacterium]MBL33795.1 hypothetical protein [Oceanospirillaceae bacterium]MBS53543.1 hypothetical protein [Oceanospirillaceae bacterium]
MTDIWVSVTAVVTLVLLLMVCVILLMGCSGMGAGLFQGLAGHSVMGEMEHATLLVGCLFVVDWLLCGD